MLRNNKRIIELPIYNISEEVYEETNLKKRKKIEEDCEDNKRFGTEKFNKCVDSIYYSSGYQYQYNEIVGWIEIYVDGNQFLLDIHMECNKGGGAPVLKQRYQQIIRPKQFKLYKSMFVLFGNIYPDTTSSEIYNRLIEGLDRFVKNHSVFQQNKTFVLDTKILKNIGKHIDWSNLTKDFNPLFQ